MVAFEHGLDHSWPFYPLSAADTAIFVFEIDCRSCIPCCPLSVAVEPVVGVVVLMNPTALIDLLHFCLPFGNPSHT